MAKKKRLRFSTACPQCGCSAVAHLTKEEIKERFGDIPNIDLECEECTLKYSSTVKEACPEWDDACKGE